MAGRAMFGGAGGDAGEGYAYVGSRVSLGSLLDEEITTLLAEHRQDGLMQLLQARRGAPFTSTAPAWPCDASMRTRPPHACCHATIRIPFCAGGAAPVVSTRWVLRVGGAEPTAPPRV